MFAPLPPLPLRQPGHDASLIAPQRNRAAFSAHPVAVAIGCFVLAAGAAPAGAGIEGFDNERVAQIVEEASDALNRSEVTIVEDGPGLVVLREDVWNADTDEPSYSLRHRFEGGPGSIVLTVSGNVHGQAVERRDAVENLLVGRAIFNFKTGIDLADSESLAELREAVGIAPEGSTPAEPMPAAPEPAWTTFAFGPSGACEIRARRGRAENEYEYQLVKLASGEAVASGSVTVGMLEELAEIGATVGAAARRHCGHSYVEAEDAEEVEDIKAESALAATGEAAAAVSQTVIARVLALRPAAGGGFRRPTAAAYTGPTGLNAGDEPLPDYPDNASIDVTHGKTRSPGRFESRSTWVVGSRDTLLDWNRLLGYGVGVEQIREALPAGYRRTRGVTATAWMAQILDDNFTVVPQAALSWLLKRLPDGRNGKAGRAMLSLTLLGQETAGYIDLSGFAQAVYSYEKPVGAGRRVYLGQAIAGAEAAVALGDTGYQPYIGARAAWDLARSHDSGRKLGWEASAGLRAALASNATFDIALSFARKGDERGASGNAFVKFFF